MSTSVGQLIRPCWPAQRTNQNRAEPPNLRARLGNVFAVDAVSSSPAPHGAVRIGGQIWIKSWLRVQ